MIDAFIWFLSIELLGLLALPLAFVLFPRLPDRGFTLAKPLALILSSYLLWILGLTHVAPNSQGTVIGILAVGGIAGALVVRRQWHRLGPFIKTEWRTLLAAEAVFLAFFLLWLGIVSEVPAITGTEKPMDFAFLNGVLQSRYFPPEDPWLAGHSISYYYFGHFTMALLTQLTGIASSVSYNLSISLIPALVAAAAFGLVYNLIVLSGGSRGAAIRFGMAAPGLLLLIGNLEGVLEFINAQGWGSAGFWEWVGIKGLDVSPSGPMWWRASRVIDTLSNGQSLDYTITEFPFFSFLLGDLHAHVISLPFVVLGLALCLNVFMSQDRLGFIWLRRHPVESIAVALILGSVGFINAWDLPPLAAVLFVAVLAKVYGQEKGGLRKTAGHAALMVSPILVAAVVLYLPYYLTLDNQASSIRPLTGVGTRPFSFLLVMGLFFVLGVGFVLRQLSGLSRPARSEVPAITLIVVVAVTPLLIWAGIAFLITASNDGLAAAIMKIGGRTLFVLPGLAIVVLAASSGARRVLLGRDPVMAFPLLLLAVAFYLLVGAELFWVVDLFQNRMNTVFKVYYQVWLLLSLVGAYGLYFWSTQGKTSRDAAFHESSETSSRTKHRALRAGQHAWTAVIALLLVASLYYPAAAILDRTGILSQGHSFSDNSLDGLEFINASRPGEYAAIQWLRDQAPYGRIVEAVSNNDFSEYGRISASTGLPTVLGWWVTHERQWRGGSRLLEGRQEDIATIYESRDGEEVRLLLERYGVRYVYLGSRERTSYGGAHLADFATENGDNILRTAFQRRDVVIYEFIPMGGQAGPGDDNSGPG